MKPFLSHEATYIYCGFCGHEPKDENNPNRASIVMMVGNVLPYAKVEIKDIQPKLEDYAYHKQDQMENETDLDLILERFK